MDHLGSIAKVSIPKAVALAYIFLILNKWLDYLNNKFKESRSPKCYFKETDAKKIDELCARAKANKYETLQGSNKFHVIMFWSNSDNLRAALCLCFCEQCKVNYEDCVLFSDFPLSVIELNQKNL